MVVGVSAGFEKKMEMVGTGYRASTSGKELTLNVGYSKPRILAIPEGVQVKVGDELGVWLGFRLGSGLGCRLGCSLGCSLGFGLGPALGVVWSSAMCEFTLCLLVMVINSWLARAC